MKSNSKGCYCLNSTNNDEFVKWAVELLAPVLLGVKPSEIVSFPEKNQLSKERREAVKQIFSWGRKVNYKEFEALNGCRKILFYHCEALEGTLQDNKNLKFLRSHGYPWEYNLHNYLDHLIKQMERGNIPHEIGIFLGYPLKDVLGFMGHPSLKLTKVNGWRVYGDPRLSDEKYVKILDAKRQIRNMLETKDLGEIIQSA